MNLRVDWGLMGEEAYASNLKALRIRSISASWVEKIRLILLEVGDMYLVELGSFLLQGIEGVDLFFVFFRGYLWSCHFGIQRAAFFEIRKGRVTAV